MNEKATLEELEVHWSLDDVVDANAVLTAWENAQAAAASEGNASRGKR